MWAAYRGTPDEADVGDLPGAAREIQLTLNGEYGTFLREASFVADHEDRPIGAALVTLYRDDPSWRSSSPPRPTPTRASAGH